MIQTVNRRGETVRVRTVTTDKLPLRFLGDIRVQELVETLQEFSGLSPVAAIIERGRRPVRVIPLSVGTVFQAKVSG